MRAALIEEFRGAIKIGQAPDPVCQPHGAIIRVEACGVCRSDHHSWSGHDPDVVLPHVMGHEFAGVIVETGSDTRRVNVGDRVTAPFILGCGECKDCISGNATICDHQDVMGFTDWGAFAEMLAVPNADFNLVGLPEEMDYATAAGMGCRVTTSYRALTDRLNLKPREWLAVHGCGGVGLAAIQIAKALGARVIAMDLNHEALTLAKKFGAEKILNVASTDRVGETIRAFTDGGAHASIDALGMDVTYENSIRGLRKLGRHVQVGMPVKHPNVNLPLLELVYSRQISIMGSRGIAPQGFNGLMALATSKNMDLSSLVTKTIGLSEVEASLKAMDHFQASGVTVITDMQG
ncbi:MAG: alcohol dehydrogenase catalytic domain-containing protein [Pseudomonadota bacterium]